MPSTCSVVGCKSRGITQSGIQFFQFPLQRGKVLAQWLAVLDRQDWVPKASSKICSLHFAPEDYLHRPNINVPRLKLEAVPSIFPDPSRHELYESKINSRNKISPVSIESDSNTDLSADEVMMGKSNENLASVNRMAKTPVSREPLTEVVKELVTPNSRPRRTSKVSVKMKDYILLDNLMKFQYRDHSKKPTEKEVAAKELLSILEDSNEESNPKGVNSAISSPNQHNIIEKTISEDILESVVASETKKEKMAYKNKRLIKNTKPYIRPKSVNKKYYQVQTSQKVLYFSLPELQPVVDLTKNNPLLESKEHIVNSAVNSERALRSSSVESTASSKSCNSINQTDTEEHDSDDFILSASDTDGSDIEKITKTNKVRPTISNSKNSLESLKVSDILNKGRSNPIQNKKLTANVSPLEEEENKSKVSISPLKEQPTDKQNLTQIDELGINSQHDLESEKDMRNIENSGKTKMTMTPKNRINILKKGPQKVLKEEPQKVLKEEPQKVLEEEPQKALKTTIQRKRPKNEDTNKKNKAINVLHTSVDVLTGSTSDTEPSSFASTPCDIITPVVKKKKKFKTVAEIVVRTDNSSPGTLTIDKINQLDQQIDYDEATNSVLNTKRKRNGEGKSGIKEKKDKIDPSGDWSTAMSYNTSEFFSKEDSTEDEDLVRLSQRIADTVKQMRLLEKVKGNTAKLTVLITTMAPVKEKEVIIIKKKNLETNVEQLCEAQVAVSSYRGSDVSHQGGIAVTNPTNVVITNVQQDGTNVVLARNTVGSNILLSLNNNIQTVENQITINPAPLSLNSGQLGSDHEQEGKTKHDHCYLINNTLKEEKQQLNTEKTTMNTPLSKPRMTESEILFRDRVTKKLKSVRDSLKNKNEIITKLKEKVKELEKIIKDEKRRNQKGKNNKKDRNPFLDTDDLYGVDNMRYPQSNIDIPIELEENGESDEDDGDRECSSPITYLCEPAIDVSEKDSRPV